MGKGITVSTMLKSIKVIMHFVLTVISKTHFHLARMLHEFPWRDREDGRATGQPSRGTAGLDLRRT